MSILKKRDDRDGKTVAQVQQSQTKRRVRFQEMEDTFDQGTLILLTHSMRSQGANDVERGSHELSEHSLHVAPWFF